MRATAVLVRSQNGWSAFDTDAVPGIEMCQGHSGDGPEVVRKAAAELATYGDGQTEITVAVNPPEGDPVPGIDWIEGDEVHVDGAWREGEALAMALVDASSQWQDAPQFGTVLDGPEDRIRGALRGIGGLNGGTSHLTRPVAEVAQPNVKP